MPRLLVLGNAGLDLGLSLPSLPQPGETTLGRAGGRAPGGKGLNQAAVAARAALGPVLFRAPIGDDAEGQAVAGRLRAEPFHHLELPVLPLPTDLSVLLVLPGGENAIVSAGDCAHALDPADAAAFAAGCDEGDWLLLQGNLLEAAAAAAIDAARARAACVMLNTAPMAPFLAGLLPACDLVVANEGEAALLPPHAAGVRIVTGGAAGCTVLADGVETHWAAYPAAAVDTTGAGDAFCGVLAACRAVGRPLPRAVAAAQRAAALTVTRPGAFAALPTARELAPILEEPGP